MALQNDYVSAWNTQIKPHFDNYMQQSECIGGLVKEQAMTVKQGFDYVGSVIAQAQKSSKPASKEALTELMQPFSKVVTSIQAQREKHRADTFFVHLSAVSESIAAFFWVIVDNTDPAKFVKDLSDAGAYYGNKVMVEYKSKDPSHVQWAKSWLEVLTKMTQYIRTHHRRGLSWNQGASAAPAGNAPMPPPPPPPMEAPPAAMPKGDDLSDNFSLLMKEIRQGTDIVKSLRRSPRGEKHLEAHHESPIPSPGHGHSSRETARTVTHPPKFELDGRKWCIEYQKAEEIVVQPSMQHTVYVYKCEGTFIKVNDKVTGITFDSCKSVSLLCNDVISSVEFINCNRVNAQTLGRLPTLSIVKTDNVQVYMNKNALDVEIVTEKASEVNISLPKGDDDFDELPVPEQLKTVIVNGKLQTVAIRKE